MAVTIAPHIHQDVVFVRAKLEGLANTHLSGGSQCLQEAIEFAFECHAGKRRKGTEAPYVIHPLRISTMILDELDQREPNIIRAALLHDVVEDCAINPETLRTRFGPQVADFVTVLSRREREARPADGDPPNSPYLMRIANAGAAPLLLKLTDKIDNLRDAAYVPDRARVNVWIGETKGSYLPLLQHFEDRIVAERLEHLLRDAAKQAARYIRMTLPESS